MISAHEIAPRGYGTEETARFAHSRHGADGAMFLDPHVSRFLDLSKGLPVHDVGAGAGTISIEAIERGAKSVFASDKYPAMVNVARRAVAQAGFQDVISVEEADAAELPYPNNCAERILLVNVGCNLDNKTLKAHFQEASRIIKRPGLILVTLPFNLGEIFSNGDITGMQRRLIYALDVINSDFAAEGVSQGIIQKYLGEIEQIQRGTFIAAGREIKLVVDHPTGLPADLQRHAIPAAEIKEGEPIFRKLPGLVVPNNYHTLLTYERLMTEADLSIVAKHADCFPTEEARAAYNSTVSDNKPGRKLGAEYVGKGPFVVYVLQRYSTFTSERN